MDFGVFMIEGESVHRFSYVPLNPMEEWADWRGIVLVILQETKDQHFKPGTGKGNGELQKGQSVKDTHLLSSPSSSLR